MIINIPKCLYLNIHICLNDDIMTTKTITITESAYKALVREKRENESFSKLALRLTKKNGTLKECMGLWNLTRKERKIFEKIKDSWAESDKEIKRRLGSS